MTAKNQKICVICGKSFDCSPSVNKITCSKPCSIEQKRRSHLGKRNVWSDDARARARQRGQTGNLSKGTAAARLSPVSGPFETNQNAKHWVLRSPDNVLYEFDNLSKFVRDHPDFFANAVSARTALSAAAGCTVGTPAPSRKSRKVNQYKGWEVVSCGLKSKKEDTL